VALHAAEQSPHSCRAVTPPTISHRADHIVAVDYQNGRSIAQSPRLYRTSRFAPNYATE